MTTIWPLLRFTLGLWIGLGVGFFAGIVIALRTVGAIRSQARREMVMEEVNKYDTVKNW